MKKSETIKSLDSISPANSLSKNGILFEKVLSHRSFKTLINKLKNPKKLKILSYIEEFKLKYPYESTTNGFQDDFFSDSIFDIMHEEENKDLIMKDNNNIKNSKYNISKYRNNIDYLDLHPFKYNPNYNSIYKNSPTTKIYLPKKKKLNRIIKTKLNRNIFLTNVFNKQNNKQPLIIKNIDNTNFKKPKIEKNIKSLSKKYSIISKYKNNINNINNINNNKKSKLTIINTNYSSSNNIHSLPHININNKLQMIKNSKSEENLNINLDSTDNKHNHALRFSKYYHKEDKEKNKNDIVSYINYNSEISIKNIKAIDFGKMKPHSIKYLLNMNIINNPSICYYEPNYDALIKKKYVIFSPNKITNKLKRKNILKKIWSSYDVHKEYLSIDNDKLNEGINKK